MPLTMAFGPPVLLSGSGSPEGSVTGSVGDIYRRTGGGTSTTLYVKESGAATNTGWVAHGAGGGGGTTYNTYVSDSGAVGDGTTNDYTALAAAVTAAGTTKVLVFQPGKTYLSSSNLTIPADFTIEGNGAWLKGTCTFSSGVTIRNLKMGNTAARHSFASGATDILFDNCWFFGGTNEGIIYMNDNSVSNVRFVGCELSGNTSGGNGVDIVDKGTVAKHIENITFHRCWFHGNDRMNFECIQRDDVGFPVVSGYRNISLYDCVLDGNSTNINVSYDSPILADSSARSSGYSTVRGCKITSGQTCLELAGPTDMLIEGNDVRDPVGGDVLSMSQYGTATDERKIARIVGNSFASTTGSTTVSGDGVVFSGNTVKGLLTLSGSSYSSVCGNKIEAVGNTALALLNAGSNVVTGNELYNAASYAILIQYAASINNTIVGNFIHTTATTGSAYGSAYNIVDGQHYIGHNSIVWNGGTYGERTSQVKNVTYSASMTPDRVSIVQRITPSNTTAFTINLPGTSFPGEVMTFDIGGLTGVMGVITWNAAYHLAGAFVNPATTKRRTISFYFDGSAWIETSRAAADI